MTVIDLILKKCTQNSKNKNQITQKTNQTTKPANKSEITKHQPNRSETIKTRNGFFFARQLSSQLRIFKIHPIATVKAHQNTIMSNKKSDSKLLKKQTKNTNQKPNKVI